MQKIDLDLDKDNELVFKLSIVGSSPATSESRFMLESGSYSLSFPASRLENGEVTVQIPSLEKVLKEGTYSAVLEVIVDNRIFKPIELTTEFKKSLSVVAESVVRRRPEMSVTASSVVVVNKEPEVIVESPNIATRKESHAPKRATGSLASYPATLQKTHAKIIERISKKHGIELSEGQLKEVLRKFKILKELRKSK
jgi:hypothetical protein